MEFGSLGVWEFWNLGVWQFGSLGMWGCESLGVWELGNPRVWEFGILCWFMLIHVDLMLIYIDLYWFMLIYIDLYWFCIDLCWFMMIYVDLWKYTKTIKFHENLICCIANRAYVFKHVKKNQSKTWKSACLEKVLFHEIQILWKSCFFMFPMVTKSFWTSTILVSASSKQGFLGCAF